MGRDNHPRIRQRQKLERKKAIRDSYDRILIVCEGKKTEPQYFEEIRQHYKLNTANIKIMPSDYGTTPQQVVDCARDELQKTRAWEHVFCVFDRDEHPNFDNALKSAEALNLKYRNELNEKVFFTAIPSIPCFELWLLLHFVSISKYMHREDVVKKLRHHLPKYEKGSKGNFLNTQNKLDIAFHNAHLIRMQDKNNTSNPSTRVDELVKQLIKLKL